ncbi:MAG: hypothetical protein KUG79_15260, partial [Pseudomonadales bacterium]|nr:hypothetical protein [Pseudomonadales bacterium]
GLGVIDLLGTQTLNLATPFDISASSTLLDFGGTITVNGALLSVLAGGQLILTADTVNADLDNQGNVFVEENASSLNSTNFTNIGQLFIQGTVSTGSVTLNVANGFTNAGIITLDNLHTASRTETLNILSGALTNTGTIFTANTGGGGGAININGDFANAGLFDIDQSVTINSALFDNTFGSIDVLSGQILTINSSSSTFGASTSLLGLGIVDLIGTQTLNLISPFDISASAAQLKFGGTVTVDGSLLTIFSGAQLTLTGDTINADLDNQGDVFVQENATSINSGTLTNTGQLAIEGTSPAGSVTLNLSAGFTNMGQIRLDNLHTASRTETLNILSGTLFNGGTILTTNSGGGGGQITINGSITSTGVIDIEQSATLSGAGAVVDTTLGSIVVDPGNTLTIVSDLVIGTSSAFLGGGVVDLAGSLVTVASAFTVLASMPTFDLSGIVTINGGVAFTVDSGAQFTLTGDTANVEIDNQGTLTIQEDTTVINSSVFTNTGLLSIEGSSPASSVTLMLTNAFANDGTIVLDNIHTASRNVSLSMGLSQLFTNNGTITTANSGGGGGVNTIGGDISNIGTINVVENLVLSAISSTNQSSGLIIVSDTKTLTISGGVFNNDGNINLLGGSASTTLDLNGLTTFNNNTLGSITGTGTVLNSAIITGAGTFTVAPGASPGTLLFEGDLNTNINLESELEGEVAGLEYDQVLVTGTANLGGHMNVALLNGYMPTLAAVYVVLSAGELLGSFDYVTGLDVSDAVVLDIVYRNNNVELVGVDTTIVGDSQAEEIVGTATQDVVVAGEGDDQITTFDGGDIVFGQAGDDNISVASDFKRVDGGDGIDTLKIIAIDGQESFAYQQFAGSRIDFIEVISLDNQLVDEISLDAEAIKNIVDGENALTGVENSLVIVGETGDRVRLEGAFTQVDDLQFDAGRGEELFQSFTDGEATLFVSQEILLSVDFAIGLSQLAFSSESLEAEPIPDTQGELFIDAELGLASLLAEAEVGLNLPTILPAQFESASSTLLDQRVTLMDVFVDPESVDQTGLQTDTSESASSVPSSLSSGMSLEALLDNLSKDVQTAPTTETTLPLIVDNVQVAVKAGPSMSTLLADDSIDANMFL